MRPLFHFLCDILSGHPVFVSIPTYIIIETVSVFPKWKTLVTFIKEDPEVEIREFFNLADTYLT